MLFAIDAGNTNITIGLFDGEKLEKTFRMTTGISRTSDEYGVFLLDWLRMRQLSKDVIDEVIEFKHTAYSKSVFAKGAVEAGKFLKGKAAGMYDMADVIG